MCGNGKNGKNTSCVNVLSRICPQAWPGGRKSSSLMASVIAGFDTLKEVAAQQVSDQQLETARFRFPYNTPTSKEAYLYREIFEELFPLPSAAECVPGGPFRRLFFRQSDRVG